MNIDTIVGGFVQNFWGPLYYTCSWCLLPFSVLILYPCLIAVSIGESFAAIVRFGCRFMYKPVERVMYIRTTGVIGRTCAICINYGKWVGPSIDAIDP